MREYYRDYERGSTLDPKQKELECSSCLFGFPFQAIKYLIVGM